MSIFPYSPTEQALLDLLKTTKLPLDIHALVDWVYKDRERPFNDAITVRSAIMTLSSKVIKNREPFTVQRIKQVGRKPALFCIVEKKQTRSGGNSQNRVTK